MDAERKSTVLQKDDGEHAVPSDWRPMFHEISEAFADGDFGLRYHVIQYVAPVDPSVAQVIADYISAYDDAVISLDPATWDRSIYRWMDGYWHFLVDLTTAGERVSDLTLHARLCDTTPPRLEVESVHVP